MDELVSEQELAAWLKVSPHTLRTWRNRSQGPAFVRAGSLYRYKVSDVQTWLDARKITPGKAGEVES